MNLLTTSGTHKMVPKVPTKKTLLLVDLNNLLYRGLYVHPNLSFRGVPTGPMYGCLTQICSAVRLTSPDRVVACLDMRPYLREKHLPEYKGDRVPMAGDDLERAKWVSYAVSANRSAMEELLPMLRVQVLGKPGLEADDVIAALVNRYVDDFDEVVILSNDKDLYQLLGREEVCLLVGAGQTKSRYRLRSFQKEYKLEDPAQWVDVLALTGGHNAVPGLSGVGVSRAVQYLTKGSPLVEGLLEDPANAEAYRIGKEMATLPYPYITRRALDSVKLLRKNTDTTERELIMELGRYGIKYSPSLEETFRILSK
jgi:5'-3' exonuclease